MNIDTFHDLILEDIEKGRTYTYVMYLSKANVGQQDKLTFDQAADALGHLFDFSRGEFSSAKLLGSDQELDHDPSTEPIEEAVIYDDAIQVTDEPVAPKKVWTKKPKNQNEWSLRIWNDYKLTSTQKLILLGLAIEFGMEVGKTGKPFGECTTEAANSYIQGHAKISERAARLNLSKLVEAGWLRRLDNGKGGRGGKGRAVYLPTLPS